MFRFSIVALALALPVAAIAAPPAASVALNFAPPVDTPLRYAITRTRDRTPTGGALVRTLTTTEEEVRIARVADGYLATWRPLKATAPTPAGAKYVAAVADAFRAAPPEIRLDRLGRMGEIANWAVVQAALGRAAETLRADIPARVAAMPSEQRESAKRAFETPPAAIERLTADAVKRQFLGEMQLAFGWGGLSIAPGGTASEAARLRAAIFNTDLAARRVTRIETATPEAVTLVAVTTPDPGTVAAEVDKQIATILPLEPAESREGARETMLQVKGLVLEDRIEATIARATGIATRARLVRRVETPGVGTQTDTFTVEAIGPAAPPAAG